MLTYLQRIEWFIGLVLLQVLVLNHMHINGYATPFFFIYFILKYNSGVSRNVLMIWAFLLGLTVDILGNTPGMNGCATVLAFMNSDYDLSRSDSVEDFELHQEYGILAFLPVYLIVYFLILYHFTCHRYFFILQPACLIVENIDRCLNNHHLCVLRQSGGKNSGKRL